MSRRLVCALLALLLTGCAGTGAQPVPTATPAVTATPSAPVSTLTPAPTRDPEAVDVDLTELSSTMVFAEVAAMVRDPEQYLGKRVRMQGQLAVYPANPALDVDYFYTVVVQDATACCQQGLEFIWEDGTQPEAGTELVVTGIFTEYDCGGLPSHHIVAESVETTG
ncbi:hypothetical protein H6B10_02330 [Gemmiger formicilis]|uniref:hypothetical protein n=1 Tax=Gemmiger formicilis TaxID=745368 RepID=UPI00195D1D8B|nr:hypothetical protein [Gemmiger formicilis]MBM6898553.1 hypothetical protein [Gemmiger formicilis]